MQQETIQLKLTVEETNLILDSLGQRPFVSVHQLIANIQQQAELLLSQNNVNSSRESDTESIPVTQ